jgi:ferredoxin--NADP+ reductase
MEQLNSIVTQVIQVSPTMKIFRIAPDGWALPDFTPGQFAALALPASAPRCEGSEPDAEEMAPEKMIKRVYSIASSSISKQFIEFYITWVRSGTLTPRLFALKIGDRIELGKKAVGMFTLDQVPANHNVVLVATGTGVAPYVSMLRSNVLGAGNRKIAVIHGASNSWDLGYSSELILLQSISDRFYYLPTVIDVHKEPVPWGGDKRFVQEMWAGGVVEKVWGFKPTPENTHIFLCGNPKMVKSMFDILGTQNFSEYKKDGTGQIHVESWG